MIQVDHCWLTRSELAHSRRTFSFDTHLNLTMGLGRLFIPVRGSASLHWIDLKADGKMACGQTKDSPSCDDGHRVGTDSDENARGERMPNEPYGIAINDEGDAIAITHQTSGKVSLVSPGPRTGERRMVVGSADARIRSGRFARSGSRYCECTQRRNWCMSLGRSG